MLYKKTGAPREEAPSPTGAAESHTLNQIDFSTLSALMQFARQGLFNAALIWLARGFDLVPLVPGRKWIIRGFGPLQRHITTEQECRIWFLRNACNLGVVIAPGFYCADFDDRDTMRAWRAGPGEDLQTYTEKTAHGFHSFFVGDVPRGLAGPGLELKAAGQVVMSAPSIGPDGTGYTWFSGQWPPAACDWRQSFFSFLSKRPDRPLSAAPAGARPSCGGRGLVNKIKQAFGVLDELKAAGVDTWRPGGKDTYVALCPFHDDHSPSLWAKPGLGIWGCNSPSCPAHGTHDVINARALANGFSVREAIRQMAHELTGNF